MSFNMTKEEWNKAIDNYILEENAKVGKPRVAALDIPNSWPQVHSLITEEAIRDFAWNLGCTNPLYTDPEYAKNTVWKGMIAPQGRFINYIAEAGNLDRGNYVPGQTHLYGGTTYEYNDVMRAGDSYTIEDEYLGVVEKKLAPEKAAKYRLLIMTAKRHYINQNGVTVVTATGEVAITCVYPAEIRRDGKSAVLGQAAVTHYDDETLEDLHRYYEAYFKGEYFTGAAERYWDDVSEGDELPVLKKGPIDVMDIVGYQTGIAALVGGGASKWELLRHGLSAKDPCTGEYLPRVIFHYDKDAAKQMGHPTALVFAAMQEAYISETLSNWMGDSGFIKKLTHRARKPCFHGDMIFTKGSVVRKFEENGESLVEVSITTVNQNGVEICPSKAIIRLPRR